MINNFKKVLLIIMVLLSTTSNVFPGHHGDSKLSRENPEFDINDIFVFESSTGGYTTFVLSFYSQDEKDKKKLAGENGLYKFNIASDKTFQNGFSFVVDYRGSLFNLYKSDKFIPSLDEKGQLITSGNVFMGNHFQNGIRMWIGFSKDPFQGNAFGLRQLKESAEITGKEGFFDIKGFDQGEAGNIFGKMRASVIVMEVPNYMLPKDFYYYASTTAQVGNDKHWHQINRIANVLFPHVYLNTDEEKTKHVTGSPLTDINETQMFSSVVEKFVTLSGYRKDPKVYVDSIAKLLLPDVVHYTTGTKAIYGLAERKGMEEVLKMTP